MSMLQTGVMLAAAMASVGLGANLPVNGAKPLSEVLVTLDKGGLRSVTEVSFDDGVWEVEGIRDGRPVELHIDPLTCKIINERADEAHPVIPGEGKSLIEICKAVEDAGYSPVTEAEYEPTGWEIETLHNGAARQLVVDGRTGKILSDQPDD